MKVKIEIDDKDLKQNKREEKYKPMEVELGDLPD